MKPHTRFISIILLGIFLVISTNTRAQTGAVQKVDSVISKSSHVFQNDIGYFKSIGCREANKYYVDGIPMTGTLPPTRLSFIEQIDTVTGGTRARYESPEGGIIQLPKNKKPK